MTEPPEKTPSFFALIGFGLLSLVLMLLAAGVVVQVAWNAGIVGATHAAGGHLSTISYTTAYGIAVTVLAAKWVLRAN